MSEYATVDLLRDRERLHSEAQRLRQQADELERQSDGGVRL